ncbi:MAG: hypothetical protein QF893_06385 [Alphaproteobacteria bacterium]|nr:hypothetical protein [Alphaproteobacteria bacterium]
MRALVRRLILAALIIATTPSAMATETITARGRLLAKKHCTLCHVVGDLNRFGGIGSTPSFQLLASMKDGEERFRSFFARRPHVSFVTLPDTKPPTDYPLNVKPLALSYDEVEAIAVFALTLKDPRLAE